MTVVPDDFAMFGRLIGGYCEQRRCWVAVSEVTGERRSESRPYGEGTALAHIVGTVVVAGPCDVESPWQMSETLAAEIESARMGV